MRLLLTFPYPTISLHESVIVLGGVALIFFEFGQHAVTILGVEEDDGLAVGADAWLLGQEADLLGLQLLHRLLDVVDFDADVVHSSRFVLVQEGGDGAFVAQGMQEFELRVAQVDEHHRHAVGGQVLRIADGRPQNVPVENSGLFEVGHDDGNVVQVPELKSGRRFVSGRKFPASTN